MKGFRWEEDSKFLERSGFQSSSGIVINSIIMELIRKLSEWLSEMSMVLAYLSWLRIQITIETNVSLKGAQTSEALYHNIEFDQIASIVVQTGSCSSDSRTWTCIVFNISEMRIQRYYY